MAAYQVAAPIAGATKLHHIEGAAKAVELTLTPEETAYLENLMCRISWQE